MTKPRIVVIQGPTASGKTTLSIKLAKHFKGEIISADSRQFYREMNLGTAKPSKKELASAKHHFISFISIANSINVSDFEKLALDEMENMFQRSKIPFIVGGSGLFVRAITEGLHRIPEIDPGIRKELASLYEKKGLSHLLIQLSELDPDTFQKIDKNNPRRVVRALEVCLGTNKPFSYYTHQKLPERAFSSIKIAIHLPTKLLYARIDERCDEMIAKGLIKEVEGLLSFRHLSSLNTIGYTEFFDYFENKCTLDEAITKFKQHSRNYAKRQYSWLRRDKEIQWFDFGDYQKIQTHLTNKLN